MSSGSECRQKYKYHLLRTGRILYGFHRRQLLMPTGEFLPFRVQTAPGAEPLRLSWFFFSFYFLKWKCLYCRISELCANGSSLDGIDLWLKTAAISFRKLPEGLLQNFCVFGEAATFRAGVIGVHPVSGSLPSWAQLTNADTTQGPEGSGSASVNARVIVLEGDAWYLPSLTLVFELWTGWYLCLEKRILVLPFWLKGDRMAHRGQW